MQPQVACILLVNNVKFNCQEVKMNIGERLKELRKKAGYSQETLANKLNISRQAVAKWEQDVCEPGIDNLVTMADLFKVDLDYLMTGREKQNNPVKAEVLKKQNLLDKADIVILIFAMSSLVMILFLFIYSILNPIYSIYHQTGKSSIWWYVPHSTDANIWFLTTLTCLLIFFIIMLIVFLKRHKNKSSKQKEN